ncbi:MAG: 4-hydroxythreonine-4-phosphate dehydrogenase PdxA [Gammaproteobacteria bacterium]|nr:4-hydroxythreonine-4-phosphate dehydrogenase PdxA [Gammaproteobacteria bacterium]
MSSTACSKNSAIRIVVTPGEPAGVGPDLALALATRSFPGIHLTICADPALLAARGRELGLPRIDVDGRDLSAAEALCIEPIPLRVPVRRGHPDPANAPYVLACLDRAVDGCRAGEFDALVTGPIQKSTINAAGIPFTGHTEYLALRTGGARPVMVLCNESLRIALVTTHLPLRLVPQAVTSAAVEETIDIVWRTLRDHYGIPAPTVAVLGLNPHAGENGALGTEERDRIEPAIERLRARGLRLIGPLSADTAFLPARRAVVDAYVAMYHDQALPVIKTLGFGTAVNVTFGLPIIRTSVDHGTALELAGTGRADSGSVLAAIAEAARLVTARRAARS